MVVPRRAKSAALILAEEAERAVVLEDARVRIRQIQAKIAASNANINSDPKLVEQVCPTWPATDHLPGHAGRDPGLA